MNDSNWPIRDDPAMPTVDPEATAANVRFGEPASPDSAAAIWVLRQILLVIVGAEAEVSTATSRL